MKTVTIVLICLAFGFALGRLFSTAAPVQQKTAHISTREDDIMQEFDRAAANALRAMENYCAQTADPWCQGNGPNPLRKSR